MRTRHAVWTGTSDANVKLTEYTTTCSGARSQYGAIAMQSRQVSGLAPKNSERSSSGERYGNPDSLPIIILPDTEWKTTAEFNSDIAK